ncbi:MAG: threonylcarbamoyl-AMP synthase [Sphingomonadales bacterium]|nr:threonylcarbamoyl-AMP synthase [Sphingomonadales bacterium]MDE2170846.1 threonylcarbamoyl-AMP synthase [Sphingomonadales bacterium]
MNMPILLAADEAGMAQATQRLMAGDTVALPTETVYGLAARADSAQAVASIYRAKGRPDFNPLIVHVADVAAAQALAEMDERALTLARAFWPGPLTMVLPRKPGAALAEAVTAGLSTVALRCPSHPVMRALLERSGLALAAPSANRSGGVSPTEAWHVAQSLAGRIGLVIDGGRCDQGLESTILALRAGAGWQILRPGPITQQQIEAVLGEVPTAAQEDAGIEAPGQMTSHYAPGKPVRLNGSTAHDDEFHIGFGPVAGDVSLSPTGDLAEAAANLYAALHASAASPRPRVVVAPIPHEGIGAAINDRLSRAAA